MCGTCILITIFTKLMNMVTFWNAWQIHLATMLKALFLQTANGLFLRQLEVEMLIFGWWTQTEKIYARFVLNTAHFNDFVVLVNKWNRSMFLKSKFFELCG